MLRQREQRHLVLTDEVLAENGGAVGELPPESEKPSRRFLQATVSILAYANVSSKPGFHSRQILKFWTMMKITIIILAGAHDGLRGDSSDLSHPVAS